MRKRCLRIHRAVNVAPWQRLSLEQPLTKQEIDDLALRNTEALEAICQGIGQLSHLQQLTDLVNIINELAGDGRRSGTKYQAQGTCGKQLDAVLRGVAERYRMHRRIGFTGAELVLMRDGIETLSDTLCMVPRREFHRLVDYMVARAASGHVEVLRTRPVAQHALAA
jgi:hypothetical protein